MECSAKWSKQTIRPSFRIDARCKSAQHITLSAILPQGYHSHRHHSIPRHQILEGK